jgi:hypothetical protein
MLSEGSVVEPEQRAKIKLPPKAEITDCGSGCSSGSFLFTTGLKTFHRKKIMAAEEVFVIVTISILLLKLKR